MSIGKRLISTGAGGATPSCTTDTTDIFDDSSGIALYSLDYDASTAPDASTDYSGTPSNVEFGTDGHINWGAKFNADGFTNTTGGWAISTGYGSAPNQKLAFSRSGSVGGVQQTYGSITIPDNTWTHIVVSVDFPNMTTNSSIKMYINGTEDTSLTDGIGYAFQENSTYNTSIGGSWAGSAGRLFEGSIDQVRIFNKALDSTEVGTLYAETACVYTGTTQSHLFGCIANYNFDGDAKESMGVTAYDGTETNITYEFGRFGTAAVFNGSNSYITVPTLSGFTNYNFTMSFWFNSTSTAAQYFMDFRNPIYMEFGYDLGSGAYNNTYSFIIYTGSQYAVHSSANLRDGNWHHIAVTYDGVTLKMYIDNDTPITSTINDNTQYAHSAGNKIGASATGSSVTDGKIDQVRIFNTALSASNVEYLFNDEKQAYITKNASDPFGDSSELAFYKMENNAADSTGSNTGTNYGTTFTTTDALIGTYSASFDGNDSIQINTFSGFTNYNFTMSVWINTTDTLAYYVSLRDPIYITLGSVYSGNSVGMGIYDGSNPYYINNTAMQSLDDGNWHHVVLTHDGTNLKGYIDGSIIANVSSGTTTQYSQGTNYNRIGMRGDGNSSTYNYTGLVDQLRLFNRALEGDEVFKLYAEVIN